MSPTMNTPPVTSSAKLPSQTKPNSSPSQPPPQKKTKTIKDESLPHAKKPYVPGYLPAGKDPIIYAFRLSNLLKYGYIDYLPGKKPPPPALDFLHLNDKYMSADGWIPDDLWTGWDLENDPLHPIFDSTNFDCSPHVYALLRPSLIIASGFLYEPALYPFFAGLLDRSSQEEIPGRKPRRFRDKQLPPTSPHIFDAWAVITKLQDHICFQIGPCKGGEFAMTKEDLQGPYDSAERRHGYKEHTTFPIIVVIEEEFVNALQGSSKVFQLPRVQHYDRDAIRRRTEFHLAVTLAHEVCHAMYLYTHEWKPNTDARWIDNDKKRRNPLPPEPFYKTQRVAEIGFALESVLIDGKMIPIGVMDSKIQPNLLVSPVYGLCISRFPGCWQPGPAYPEECMGEAAQFGRQFETMYAVRMDWVHNFFTKKFWHKTVPLHGLRAYHPQRWHGVQVALKPLNPGDDVFTPETPSPVPNKTTMTSPPPDMNVFGPTIV